LQVLTLKSCGPLYALSCSAWLKGYLHYRVARCRTAGDTRVELLLICSLDVARHAFACSCKQTFKKGCQDAAINLLIFTWLRFTSSESITFLIIGLHSLGTDVMITIFSECRQFSAKKMALFSKTNVKIKILYNLALFWVKNANYFANLIGENIFEIITSVPDHGCTNRGSVSSPTSFLQLSLVSVKR
jgi:hypothetical protein